MKKGKFNQNDLILCDKQYAIMQNKTTDFKIGEMVFLRSNPENPMRVIFIGENKVRTSWQSEAGEKYTYDWSPQCILQYTYAGLIVYKQKFNICIN